MVNLRSLYRLHSEEPAAIERLAAGLGLDPVVSIGVALLLLANDGNLASLSPRQRDHYERTIRPLIE